MRINHCAIWVRDIERTRNFFEMYFDVKVGERYDNAKGFSSYFLSFPNGHCRLEIMTIKDLNQKENTPVEPKTGYGHVSISVGSKERVDTLTKELKDTGYQLLNGPRITGDGYYESCMCINNDFLLELTI